MKNLEDRSPAPAQTESRISLAPVSRSDAAELIEANIASRAYHQPWLAPCTDQAQFDAWFERTLTGATIRLICRETKSGRIFGVVSISEIVLGPLKSAYLGYYGMVGFARSGLMTEAVRRAARFAFLELGLHRLEANIQPHNLASLSLVRRIGFRKEGFSPEYLMIDGRWSDCERWALLASELPQDNPA